MNKPLPTTERFLTFQGEGEHMGRAAFFVRLYGCPLHCPWCDSAATWHKDYVPKHINRLLVEDIVEEVVNSHAPICVITGGEPMVHDLGPLVQQLQRNSIGVHLETSGAMDGDYYQFDWVTLSPKWSKLPVLDAYEAADEVKIIVEDDSSINKWMDQLRPAYNAHGFVFPTIWLHPEWSKRNDPLVLNSITESVKHNPNLFRAGWQLHKCYRADLLDARADKRVVPLGGNPDLLPLT
jgi:7-carboxy-7-deazaguanine synthase